MWMLKSFSRKTKYILVVVPASRDTINLKENFPQSWRHQALQPMFTNTIIYEIVYRLKLSFERVISEYKNQLHEKNLDLRMHVILLTDDTNEALFDSELNRDELKSACFDIEVIGKRFYPNMDLMDVIDHGVRNFKKGKDVLGILIHFWEVILGFEFYEEMIRRFIEAWFKDPESFSNEEYSQVLVYVSDFSNKIKLIQDKIDFSEILQEGKPILKNFLPRSTSIFSYFVYQREDPRYEESNPDPRRDRVGIVIKKESSLMNQKSMEDTEPEPKDPDPKGGVLIPVFLFNREFYNEIMEYSNVNLTSSFRFVDILRYLFIDKKPPDILFLKRGRFLFVKYPWDYLKAFDYINREYTLVKLEHLLLNESLSQNTGEVSKGANTLRRHSPELLQNVCESRLKNIPFIVITSKGDVLSFEEVVEKNIDYIRRLLNDWSEAYYLLMGYTFEAYPSKFGKDIIVEIFNELGISSLLIMASRCTIPLQSLRDILKEVGISQDTIRHAAFRGINVISVKTRDDIKPLTEKQQSDKKLNFEDLNKLIKINIAGGVTIANSYIGAGSVIMEGSLVTHTVLGDFVVIYPQAVIPYSIIGMHTVIGSHVVIARERARAISVMTGKDEHRVELETQKHKFLAGRIFVSYIERFGALIGEHCRIMIGVRINPGRRIGHHSRIRPGIAVYYNVPPYNELVNEETFRAVGEKNE